MEFKSNVTNVEQLNAILPQEIRDRMGQVAYGAYRQAVNNVTMDGKPMKEFHEMPEKVRNAWAFTAFKSSGKATIVLSEDDGKKNTQKK